MKFCYLLFVTLTSLTPLDHTSSHRVAVLTRVYNPHDVRALVVQIFHNLENGLCVLVCGCLCAGCVWLRLAVCIVLVELAAIVVMFGSRGAWLF